MVGKDRFTTSILWPIVPWEEVQLIISHQDYMKRSKGKTKLPLYQVEEETKLHLNQVKDETKLPVYQVEGETKLPVYQVERGTKLLYIRWRMKPNFHVYQMEGETKLLYINWRMKPNYLYIRWRESNNFVIIALKYFNCLKNSSLNCRNSLVQSVGEEETNLHFLLKHFLI